MVKKLTYEFIKKFIEKENILISTDYINNKLLLDICSENYNQNFDRYKNGHRHQKCSNIGNRKRYKNTCLKDTIRICNFCKTEYNPKRSVQKICTKECSVKNYIMIKKN